MKKILLFLLLFIFIPIVKAETYVDLEVRTTFSTKEIKDSIDRYTITIKDVSGSFKINLSKESDFREIYESILEDVPSILRIEIKSGNILYGYTYKTTSTDTKTILDVYIYDFEKDVVKDGKLIEDVEVIYDPITTSKKTNNIVITQTTEPISEKTMTTLAKENKGKEKVDSFFKVFIIAIIIVVIVFIFFTLIKVRNASK